MIDTTTLLAELDTARRELDRQRKLAREIEMENRLYEHENVRDLRREIARLKAAMPCGHPSACAVSADEGTSHCGACEREAKLMDGACSEYETLAAFALSDARAGEAGCREELKLNAQMLARQTDLAREAEIESAKWQQRFERLKARFHRGEEKWYFDDGYDPCYISDEASAELDAIFKEA